ncbi:uncharacterized protein BDR25DRAFT_237994 [Lindgomyces ingoldianus]|uniref:Uncharacterized protein n=1 Tax=Lindgomyces ingoldianus TaxID=673940 RepID=A0ACB6QGP4_9PLEO|nr:uncharacterized protein BDR25DRAFT_237994 [Lindgomyces ingoldianus]KAF2466096.1 hypothetical protein BDR25DRAFT_237994 [Lindgomyces ingoldianus]
MAKTAKLKKRQSTLHSRASRRALSPPTAITLSKSLSTTTTTSSRPSTTPNPHVLAAHSAGITKKPKFKQLKRQQRIRHQKGLERAADVLDKRELKVQKSVGKERKVRDRKKGWEDVNESRLKVKSRMGFEALEEDGGSRREREWVSDEEMPEVEVAAESEGDEVLGLGISGEVKEVVVPESVPLPVASAFEEDELL